MSQAIPTQHPAVVLRSHYTQLRMLLAVAMIAVVGLSAAVVVLAIDDGASSARPVAAPATATVPAFDRGRPDEGTRGPLAGSQSTTVPRFDVGRPQEGTRGPGH